MDLRSSEKDYLEDKDVYELFQKPETTVYLS